MKERARWSYTEILIIAVILGVFVMKVVPRVAEANPDSRICDLIDGLEQMRAQLDLYRAQHRGYFPDDSSFELAMTMEIGSYGPYVRKIPVNPFNNLNTVRFDGEPAGAGIAGWRLDTKDALFQADDSTAHASL